MFITRHQYASLAKRFLIATSFMAAPTLGFAADETPLLHVAVDKPLLGNPSGTVADGWIARERTDRRADQRTPLRDPPSVLPASPASDTPTTTVKPSQPPRLLASPEARDAAEKNEAAVKNILTPLKGLKPVPLMRFSASPTINAPTINGPAERDPQAAVHQPLTIGKPAGTAALPLFETSPAENAPPDEELTLSGELSLTEDSPLPEVSPPAGQSLEPTAKRSIPMRRPDLQRDAQGQDRQGQPSEAAEPERQADRFVGDLAEDQAAEQEVQVEVETELEVKQTAPNKQPLVISPAMQRLRSPMEAALLYYYQRPENAAERSSWGMLHSIMVYGVETQVTAGRQRYNAVAWMAGNNVNRGQRLFTVDRDGIAPRSGVGLQGHQGQCLAIFSLIGVPESYPLYVGKRKFSVADLVKHEQANCRSGEELTFTLMGLAHYLDTDAQWVAKDGQQWNFERLIQEELSQPVIGAACGGTHRLMGLSHALRIRREQGRPLSGQWLRAEQFINDFVDYAWKLQNPDGSMSTEWFEGRGDRGDIGRKIQTTGHIVEWLIGVTPDDQLQDPRMTRAISFLTNALYRNRNVEWEIGPKGHALRSLALYHDRLYQAPPPWRASAVAQGATAGRQHSR